MSYFIWSPVNSHTSNNISCICIERFEKLATGFEHCCRSWVLRFWMNQLAGWDLGHAQFCPQVHGWWWTLCLEQFLMWQSSMSNAWAGQLGERAVFASQNDLASYFKYLCPHAMSAVHLANAEYEDLSLPYSAYNHFVDLFEVGIFFVYTFDDTSMLNLWKIHNHVMKQISWLYSKTAKKKIWLLDPKE